MKYIDEFRDKARVAELLKALAKTKVRRANIMEVCGTHTVAIFRSGLRGLIEEHVNLISGPGCPVCVTSQPDIDRMIALSAIKNVVITTFGDMLRVPGTKSTLEKERAKGADVRIVYSPLDALEIAAADRKKEVVFLAVGFETTSPLVAALVSDAKTRKLRNFSVYPCHKLIPPAIKALLDAGEVTLHGFICPGHVSVTIGSKAYEFICRDYRIPCVVGGFEPVDILETILLILRQIERKKAEVEIQYSRAVKPNGNPQAQALLRRVFSPAEAEWRGLGIIPGSGLELKSAYRQFDAARKFSLKKSSARENPACSCGDILRGVKTPRQCRLFGKTCTPENPYGPCMVSTEGTCAAWYKYNRKP